ncbi:hypothetical protein B0H11DRAFT_1948206 [Mycena galericulata]|nr:hypothetical protein B0H11DRAFT_1948206 [Mycena galericulata]
MKTGSTIVWITTLIATIAGAPAKQTFLETSIEPIVSQWAAERQAVAFLKAQLVAQGQTIAPAQPKDIERLKSQWETHKVMAQFEEIQQASMKPPSQGYISVHRGSLHGPLVGFLAADKIVDTWMEATKYSIAERGLPVTQIDVADSAFRMCVAVGPLGESIGPSMAAFHHARHVPSGQPEAGPRWSKELHTFIMTSVFSLNVNSKELTIHWINPNGDSPRTMIVMAHQRVFYTGDITAFEHALGSPALVVAFRWVEDLID